MTDQRDGRESTVHLACGRQISYAEFGDPAGVPMVLLHGSPGSRLMFRPADAPARALGLRLICPDRPGCGGSSPHPGRTLASGAADTAEMLDRIGVDRVILFGVSGGAPYAVAAAAAWGPRVRLLALVSPMGPIADLSGEIALHTGHRLFFLKLGQSANLARLSALCAAALFRASPTLFHRLFANSLGNPDRAILVRPEIAAHVIADVRECLRQGPAGALQDLALFGRPWGVPLDAVSAPTLVWQGTADVVVPVALGLALAQRLRRARLTTIAGAGHFWIYDNIPPVLAEIARAAVDEPSA
jgi:pimeloyl-ACP methyl ester carboxylesterase